MNNTMEQFFKDHNIDFYKLVTQESSHIFNTKEIDEIVADFGMEGQEETKDISIADIIGYNPSNENIENIFLDSGYLFDENGSTYQSRSCDLLKIPSENIIQKLIESFKKDPIIVQHIHDNNNIIVTNGLHRYTVLRLHFLNESFGLDPESEEYESIKQKYTITAKIKNVDLIKTYSRFILSNNKSLSFSLHTDYDEKYNSTGKVIRRFKDAEEILTDEELIACVRDTTLSNPDKEFNDLIINYQYLCENFYKFIDTYLPELAIKKINNNKELS